MHKLFLLLFVIFLFVGGVNSQNNSRPTNDKFVPCGIKYESNLYQDEELSVKYSIDILGEQHEEYITIVKPKDNVLFSFQLLYPQVFDIKVGHTLKKVLIFPGDTILISSSNHDFLNIKDKTNDIKLIEDIFKGTEDLKKLSTKFFSNKIELKQIFLEQNHLRNALISKIEIYKNLIDIKTISFLICKTQMSFGSSKLSLLQKASNKQIQIEEEEWMFLTSTDFDRNECLGDSDCNTFAKIYCELANTLKEKLPILQASQTEYRIKSDGFSYKDPNTLDTLFKLYQGQITKHVSDSLVAVKDTDYFRKWVWVKNNLNEIGWIENDLLEPLFENKDGVISEITNSLSSSNLTTVYKLRINEENLPYYEDTKLPLETSGVLRFGDEFLDLRISTLDFYDRIINGELISDKLVKIKIFDDKDAWIYQSGTISIQEEILSNNGNDNSLIRYEWMGKQLKHELLYISIYQDLLERKFNGDPEITDSFRQLENITPWFPLKNTIQKIHTETKFKSVFNFKRIHEVPKPINKVIEERDLNTELISENSSENFAENSPKGLQPSFISITNEGKQIQNDSWKGKVVLYDFWASYCIPCIYSFPITQKMIEKYSGSMELVYVNMDMDEETWKNQIYSRDLKGTHLYSGNQGIISQLFGVEALPSYVLVDKKGQLRILQNQRLSFKELEEQINILLSE
jgi:thiol-disulfide isomerase/thioredoxin